MADEAHVNLVLKGRDAVAAWREANPAPAGLNLSEADLRMKDLSHFNLRLANLAGAKLHMANLEGADLFGANLHQAILFRANLVKANFSWATLSDADLSDLPRGKQQPAAHATFAHANLSGANLACRDLSGSVMKAANLQNTDLPHANCDGVDMAEANLDGANLRHVQGLTLDNNRIRNAQFEPYAVDRWSVLRRNYTGARLLFHLLLMLAFFVPIVAKTMYWVALNQAQGTYLSPSGANRSPSGRLLDGLRKHLDAAHSKDEAGMRKYSVWQLLIGADRDVLSMLLTIALLLYNACRALLTRIVGPLRDEEERSGRSPPLTGVSGYGWLMVPHRITQALFWLAVGSFAYHGWHWLTAAVVLPI